MRVARTWAATWPTSSLSIPTTARWVGFSTSKLMPAGGVDLDRVAVAEVQLQLVADLGGAVADAGDLERLAVAVRHADHHVGDERSGQAVQLLVVLGLGWAAPR